MRERGQGEGCLADLSWPALPPSPTVLVPLGSTEQHGPHLPLHTDTAVAAAVARAAAARLLAAAPDDPVLVAPAVAYGASGEHQDFPGTMSIGTAALRFLLVELVRSLSRWAGRIVIVNGHGGNLGALTAATSLLRGEGHDVCWAPCAAGPADAHAGHTETSLMLHLAPGLVDMARAKPGNLAPLAEIMPDLAAGGVAAVSPSGVLGDPTTATAGEGGRLLDRMAGDVAARIRHGRADHTGRLLPAPAPPSGAAAAAPTPAPATASPT
ncbi:mycofactocin biosynthesis peptidyl-dipeptidase MftE [Microbispora sp. NBC_01189]|uniref:mycofactocin biosynthesis peptidyl-dipeptidase MftE n=1 Tax=Microbispora sp. NBC_01189 TaxID=2903583 RepID=UPI002E101C82|nr:mycofactocin biosynthesis peptidyl-dipeptidase MftE [Microbispora sp. NBC_01189]